MSLLLAEREVARGGEEEKLETKLEFFVSTKTVHRCRREYYSFES